MKPFWIVPLFAGAMLAAAPIMAQDNSGTAPGGMGSTGWTGGRRPPLDRSTYERSAEESGTSGSALSGTGAGVSVGWPVPFSPKRGPGRSGPCSADRPGNRCGLGWQVLVAGNVDNAGETVRAFEIADREPVAVSQPAEFSGGITALWTDSDGTGAIAVSQNSETRRYEAYRLSITCGQ